MRTQPLAIAALVAASGIVLTACSSDDASAPEASGSASAAAAVEPTTLTVTSPAGSTIEMPAEPESALGFYTTDIDMLITLGFSLAEEQPIREDFTTFPSFFPQEELEGITGFANFPEYNLEKILQVGPDFILNGLGYEETLDGDLQAIAPTYTYNAFDGADWRDSFEKLAADLGRTEQWQAWNDAYEAKVAEVRAGIDEAGIDPVVADVSYWNGEVSAGCYGVPCLVLADLGLSLSPLMNADEAGLPAGDSTVFSNEQLGDLDSIDVVFTGVNEDGSGNMADDETLSANALWKDLGFVKDGEIYGYNYEMAYGSPSGQMAFLEVIEKALLG
ncbi:MAG: ABC transporter substrate-binding protein [Demequina sp.]|uniref:ABC transporter substrate-binding protein n=1 Tax=Demequina sp. TaxID=2050685 RepID=UPI003A8459A7